MSDSIQARLQKVFEADRTLREAERSFFEGVDDDAPRVEALAAALDEARDHDDAEESVARLIRVADLLTDIGGERATRLLAALLDHEEPAVRLASGEGLIDLAYSRYAEVARVFESLIDDGKAVVALREVPLLLAQVGEPGGVKLCVRLLKHPDADVVASAVQALVEFGDPNSAREIEKLKGDTRMVSADDEADEGSYTVGDFAREALDELRPRRD